MVFKVKKEEGAAAAAAAVVVGRLVIFYKTPFEEDAFNDDMKENHNCLQRNISS